MNEPNYIVHLNSYVRHLNKVDAEFSCATKKEVWKAISKQGWGGHEVWSPIGLDISEFIPF